MDIIYDYYPFHFEVVRQNHYNDGPRRMLKQTRDVMRSHMNNKRQTKSQCEWKMAQKESARYISFYVGLNHNAHLWPWIERQMDDYRNKWMESNGKWRREKTFSIQSKFRFKNHLCVTSLHWPVSVAIPFTLILILPFVAVQPRIVFFSLFFSFHNPLFHSLTRFTALKFIQWNKITLR